MYSIQDLSYKDTVPISNYSLNLVLRKRHMTNNDRNVSSINRNLIPTYYNRFFFAILSSQDKWNLVFEKLIEVFDRAEAKPIIEVRRQQNDY